MDQAEQENLMGSEATASEDSPPKSDDPAWRHRMIQKGPFITVWAIQPNGLPTEDGGNLVNVETTFNQPENDRRHALRFSLHDYVSDRVGWVAPLAEGFTQMRQVRLDLGGASNADRGVAERKAFGELKSLEYCEVADVDMRVSVHKRTLDVTPTKQLFEEAEKLPSDIANAEADSNDEEAAKLRKKLRRLEGPVKRMGLDMRLAFVEAQRQQPDLHLVIYFCPSWELKPKDSEWWRYYCTAVVRGFVEGRMDDASDLSWQQDVSSWLAMICTPWATFVTLEIPEYHPTHAMEARIRHLVVDPVILATAHQTQVQKFVNNVANLSYLSQDPDSDASRKARDDFYRWRSAFWWAQPAKATIANRVWKAAAEANNTISQVKALSQEMHDYASVEEARNKQKADQLNVRLAWGALIFAVLAIVVPLFYGEFGFVVALLVGGAILLVAAAVIGVWALRRRSKSSRARQHDRGV